MHSFWRQRKGRGGDRGDVAQKTKQKTLISKKASRRLHYSTKRAYHKMLATARKNVKSQVLRCVSSAEAVRWDFPGALAAAGAPGETNDALEGKR